MLISRHGYLEIGDINENEYAKADSNFKIIGTTNLYVVGVGAVSLITEAPRLKIATLAAFLIETQLKQGILKVPSDDDPDEHLWRTIVLSTVLPCLVVAVIVVVGLFLWRRKKATYEALE